jgi:hypothetical protein
MNKEAQLLDFPQSHCLRPFSCSHVLEDLSFYDKQKLLPETSGQIIELDSAKLHIQSSSPHRKGGSAKGVELGQGDRKKRP